MQRFSVLLKAGLVQQHVSTSLARHGGLRGLRMAAISLALSSCSWNPASRSFPSFPHFPQVKSLVRFSPLLLSPDVYTTTFSSAARTDDIKLRPLQPLFPFGAFKPRERGRSYHCSEVTSQSARLIGFQQGSQDGSGMELSSGFRSPCGRFCVTGWGSSAVRFVSPGGDWPTSGYFRPAALEGSGGSGLKS